jgi:hypothetical protein
LVVHPGVQVLELDPGIGRGEAPVDSTTGRVARRLPRRDLPLQRCPVGQPPVQALLGQHGKLDEVFFAIIERQALRRGDFASVQELIAAIRRFCDGWNQRCRPFAWTKDADQILTKLKRQNTSATNH